MAANKEIRLVVKSVQDDSTTDQTVIAEWYPKEKSGYIRYREAESEMGKTTTTVKVGTDEIKIIRHGELQSEQTFALHKRLPGFYRTPQGIIHLETITHKLDIHMVDGIGRLSWEYELFVQQESVGSFSLTLETEPYVVH
ncbi:DUF1934 domain-containing protein [Paenibacillus sp. J2TS4]|uniref:DUF1934 domain-containing protein n=1 Tax=Paenibacillus sp. J2TS4 TaxID=2807194 RepID=UPI001B09B208|nr:DUF1934 domain-containing protein [Paenibacillus sp. J2TS4]GIP36553.1 hypothetical protein J2TS4_57630 [Paenibacillus sp. J2TS4]